MATQDETKFEPVKVKDEPIDDDFIMNYNNFTTNYDNWTVKQEPEETIKLEMPIKIEHSIVDAAIKSENTVSSHSQQLKHVIYPKDYVRTAPHHCRACGKRFSDIQMLEQHASIHERTTECEICGLNVKVKSLNMHIKTHHSSKEMLQCPTCFASFKIEANLMQHMKKHEMKFVYTLNSK